MTVSNNHDHQSLPIIDGYTILETLYAGSRTIVYRAVQTATQHSVVIKTLRHEYPSFNDLVQFRNQYTIMRCIADANAKNFPISGIVHPLNLETFGNGYALVMEDWGGMALGDYIKQQSLSCAEILSIAIQLADILHDLVQHRVLHKDIKPANILIQPESKQVKLIDFSIASLLPKETQEIQSANRLEGTLAYLAPEQTGRMNRGIDYRTDFYAFGVTLYQLLSGKLPFESENSLELMHCHIAKLPLPVDQVNPEVPRMVAAIVHKLMAKNAEDRYQSAIGFKHDLEQCLTQWTETGEITEFELGQRDLNDRFLIPEKLYGREQEVQTLLNTFERVTSGASELMLVAGFSGIGKTAVVNEVHKPITRQQGYFIKGKFDQFNRNIPLSAFVQAIQGLIAQLLSESDAQLTHWKTQIQKAVGESGQVLIDVIPELEQIIGAQPPSPALSGSAAQNRFNLLFQKFIAIFTTAAHPLVIFLDDLQWADTASLQLIKLMMADNGYLLILGAYRDNEVSPVHPFILTLEELKKVNAIVNTITLAPLTLQDINHLIADILKCSQELARPLAELVERKTKGNPFFTTQFLKSLHDENCIRFNTHRCYWECDIAQVNELSLTDDVVEFMAGQLQKLPEETQQILKLAACIGSQFDLNTLAIVSQQSSIETAAMLWKVLQAGLILPMSQTYKFFQAQTLELSPEHLINPKYRFLHDRVQQAAYSLIPSDQKQIVHLGIGRHLLHHTAPEQLDDHLFEIVSQLNMGYALITDAEEQESLLRLNLRAGRKAIATTAYDTAAHCLQSARNLLKPDSWQTQYDLSLPCYTCAAEAAYLNGDWVEMETFVEVVIHQAQTLLDAAKVYEIRIEAYTSQGEFTKALATGLHFLKFFGIEFPENPSDQDFINFFSETQQQLAGRSTEALSALPAMTSRESQVLLRMLIQIATPAYLGSPQLYPLICFKQVQVSIHYGNSPASAFAFAVYGLLLCAVIGDIKTGCEFGQLSLRLLDQFDSQEYSAKVLFHIAVFIEHWQSHARSTLNLLQAAYATGIKIGDLAYTGYSAFAYIFHSYYLGQELTDLEKECQAYSIQLARIKQQTANGYLQIIHQTVANLSGQPENPSQLTGAILNEQVVLDQLKQANDQTGLWHFHVCKVSLSYLFQAYDQAMYHCQQAECHMGGGIGLLNIPVLSLYKALTCFAKLQACPAQSEDTKARLWSSIVDAKAKIQNWATHAPMNCQHRYDLICAEEQRLLDQPQQAIDFYDRAIAGAKEHGYRQEEALANELAAKFYLDWGKDKVAAGYMQEAYYCYARWGANAKTADLEKHYPQLLQPILQSLVQPFNPLETLASVANSHFSNHSSSININTLDFASILQATQAISSTIQLEDLLHQLTQIILQYSGADRCALILPNSEGEWDVRALACLREASIATPEDTQLCHTPLQDNPDLPTKLIYYVKNTKEAVIVDNGETDLPIMDDYLTQHHPQSVLCLPILNQSNLVSILYLQNQATNGVFTHDRILILNFLCTQAAISIRNSYLYQEVQNTATELEQSLQDAHQKSQDLAEIIALSNGQQRILELIAQGLPLRHLLTEIAQYIEQHSHHPAYCSFLLLDHEGRLRHGAAPSLPEAYNALVDGLEIGPAIGSCGTAAFYKACVIVEDIATDPLWAKFQIALDYGLRACASIPILGDEGQVLATLAMYQPQSGKLTRHDRKLMEIATYLARIAIERHQMDAELNQLNTQLSEQILQLQQAQLQIVQGEKMASLGNLVAGVAHEINNPIGFLNGSINHAKTYMQVLLGHLAIYQQNYPNPATPVTDNAKKIDLEFLSEDLPKLLNSMQGATDRIQDISTSLRTFSRADTEYKVKADLHEGIDSTILILKYRLKANEFRPAIEVIQDYGDLPQIDCFPGQLNQVFMNILANAIDMFDEMAQSQSYSDLEANPQQITINTIMIDCQVQIRITDNGQGMPEKVRSRIFDHLFTTKEVGKGTGLGLSIARQIVEEKHNGMIQVNSELGQGTEFLIRLPGLNRMISLTN